MGLRTRVSALALVGKPTHVFAVLHDLKEYWLNQYDWRVHEAELNAFANFTTSLRGLNVHFIHERAADVSSVPVLLLHGWPGSVWGALAFLTEAWPAR